MRSVCSRHACKLYVSSLITQMPICSLLSSNLEACHNDVNFTTCSDTMCCLGCGSNHMNSLCNAYISAPCLIMFFTQLCARRVLHNSLLNTGCSKMQCHELSNCLCAMQTHAFNTNICGKKGARNHAVSFHITIRCLTQTHIQIKHCVYAMPIQCKSLFIYTLSC